ncbi:hypothetical protein SFRURICE_004804 [Spodoptera frugiperda]|nr:hypothetical protein SFRURICE_004804 [Spodoptera frugiperda]
MVSILLLTTEEILQRNVFWHCLDKLWFTEELEPFEEVKKEHIFNKPLSRDYYYIRYPDIPRSESDDDNSLSLIGFQSKHEEWKSKISVRRFCAQRRNRHSRLSWNGIKSTSNNSLNNEPRRAISLIENRCSNPSLSTNSCMSFEKEKPSKSNDERVKDFFKRLLESVPPPPLETQKDSAPDIISCSMTESAKYHSELNDLEIPGYADFERDKILQTENEQHGLLPTTSTLKKAQRRVSFNLNTSKTEFESNESWYDSIYGISSIMMSTSVENITADADDNLDDQDYCPSWSEILMECKVNHSNIRSKSSLTSEELISRSHIDAKVLELDDSIDEETEYARFAIYKIHQTMTIQGHMLDSSSMVDLSHYECNLVKESEKDPEFFETPPENELQKNSDRVLSEHELRVQRSLQKLNVPEWYKNAPAPREGFLLRKRLSDASASAARWSGLNSKTTSLGSLGGTQQPPPPQLHPRARQPEAALGAPVLCARPQRVLHSARDSPTSGGEVRSGSTAHREHHMRASSLLQSTPKSEASEASKASEEIQTSIKEVTSAIVHYVSGLEPANGDIDRQPSPRSSQKLYWLESSFVGTKPLESPQTPLVVSETVTQPRPPSSLRLDHRAAPDWQDSQRSLNLGITRPSPGSTTLEDVLDSLLGLPSQPARIPTPQPSPRKASSPYYLMGGKSPRYEQLASSGHSSASPASRFLGTPSEGHSSITDSPEHDRPGKDTVDNLGTMQETRRPRSVQGEHSRRRSEPFAQTSVSLDRRTSLDAAALRPTDAHLTHHDSRASLASLQTENSTDEAFVKCKYPKCPSRAPYPDAKRHYKTCHNCTTMYCSKECRRAHWEKHRKVCLHTRASTLCRQIISAAKEDADALHQISTIAHKGYLALGRGVVKVFFTSPEAAEKFTTHGFQYLSEPEFMKWTSLQPNEMGVELYTEVVKLCKAYNPETRVILYVAVCIISEVPTKGAVKWERQMVSRCAKLRLSKTVTAAIQEQNRRRHRRDSKSTPEDRETLILTSKLSNAGEKNAATAHKFRQICFQNISKELESRGVNLKKHFPEVYSRLGAYVDGTSDRFIPMTIYPKDVTSGKSFMCVIMPDSEVESVTPVDGKVTTVDVGVDRSRHQLSTPM